MECNDELDNSFGEVEGTKIWAGFKREWEVRN